MYTYTIRPSGEKTYCIQSGAIEFIGSGASLTIRRDNTVVKQLKLSSEAKAHKAAKLWITMHPERK